ncbi:MAG: RdgB/HAM1 family non-canonical purine NTP pyrophosphatase [Proteobacteria bacterium]|nr:RdgB/HAM1 family non-canonical purine NTP pyrophosphatase [Pseudomonadota bacterium]
MISLLVATSNPGKLKEFKGLLSAKFLCVPLPLHTPVVVEDGTTYRENALKKAKGYFEIFQSAVLSDDSGLEVDSLQGAPGVDSATYGGENLTWPQRWALLNERLEAIAKAPSTARFRCVLCYYDGMGPAHFFEGTTEGTISLLPKGTEGFGYDPIFYSSELKKTLGEALPSEKARVSHRARAVSKFLTWASDNVS